MGDKSTMEMLQEDMLSFVVEGNTFVFDATPLKLGAWVSLFLGEKTEISRKLNELPEATQCDY